MTTHRRHMWAALVAILGGVALWQLLPGKDQRRGADEEAIASGHRAPQPRRSQGAQSARIELVGHVADGAGAPVEHAIVCVFARLPVRSDRPTCEHSNQQGNYKVAPLSPGKYELIAGAPGFLPAESEVLLSAGQETETVDFELKAGGVAVRGTVSDIGGGPIVGALVTPSTAWLGENHVTTPAVTDESGAFTVWAPEGNLSLAARGEGYAAGYAQATAPGEGVELKLVPESVLEGVVVEAGGSTPVADAIVSINAQAQSGGSEEIEVRTDESGAFRIAGLHPGRYRPVVRALHRYGEASSAVTLGVGETVQNLVIEAYFAASVSARVVVDENGTPCQQGSVSIKDKAKQRYLRTSLDAGGQVLFEAVLPGEYDVHVACDRHVSLEYPSIKVEDRPIEGLVWRVRRGAEIVGLALDDDGEPVGGAAVTAAPVDARRRLVDAETDISGQDGRFRISSLTGGRYQLSVAAPHYFTTEPPVVEAEGGATVEVRVTLGGLAKVAGEAVYADETKAAGVVLCLEGEQGESQRTISKGDGSFVFPAVRPGPVRIFSTTDQLPCRQDAEDGPAVKTKARIGKAATVRLVIEKHSGVISGRVTDERGAQVTDAFVVAEMEAGNSPGATWSAIHEARWRWGRAPTLTDTEGHFEIDRLAEGTYTVLAYRKAGGEAFASNVRTGSEVRLTIAETGSIEGTVALSDGSTPEAFTVRLKDHETGFARSEHFFRTGGNWNVSGLPAGSYHVYAEAADGTASSQLRLGPGQQLTGVALTLEGRTTVRGQVVSATDGAPLAGFMVAVAPLEPGKEPVLEFKTNGAAKNISDKNGAFEVTDAPSGRVRIALLAVGDDSDQYSLARTYASLVPGKVNELPPIAIAADRAPSGASSLGYETAPPPPSSLPSELSWVVASVRPGGPAQAAGLQVGDVIISINGRDVTGANRHLYGPLTRVPAGTVVTLGLQDGRTVDITAEESR